MHPGLTQLHPYPFEQLTVLLQDVTPADEPFISLALGEPKHPAPEILLAVAEDRETIKRGLATYPPTAGLPELREAIAGFIQRRFNAPVTSSHVLPVNGTREALFAIAQTINSPADDSVTMMPNPFYQIYEGAALLSGSKPYYLPCLAENEFKPDFSDVSEETWDNTTLLYLCTPGNPHGAEMSIEELQSIVTLAQKHDFVVVSDECYSEIYRDEARPPVGLLEAAARMGNTSFEHCLAFNSLSKRSNLPGLRSGYVAGNEALIEQFRLYRTYHGSAMSVHNQLISIAAWNDETHVIANRVAYRQKYDAFLDVLANTWPMEMPTASFYLWPQTGLDDKEFAVRLIREANIKVLPGSYLSRTVNGVNPGSGRVRLALVATLDECVSAAERIKQRWQQIQA